MVGRTRSRLWKVLAPVASLLAALALMLSVYDGGGAFAVEGTDETSFVEDVVSDTNTFWAGELEGRGYSYSPSGLTFIYDEAVGGGCGPIYPYEGPLYCRIDETLYYPVEWTVPDGGRPLEEYGYPAVAMAMAHEIGHHVQKRLGQPNARNPEDGVVDDEMVIRQELQADCFAGMWAGRDGQFEAGDTEVILSALLDLGGPTHGTPEQRVYSFEVGYYTGDLDQCLADEMLV